MQEISNWFKGETINQKQRDKLAEIINELEFMEVEEREKYENAPEGLQDSERFRKFEENACSLQEAIDLLTEVMEDLKCFLGT